MITKSIIRQCSSICKQARFSLQQDCTTYSAGKASYHLPGAQGMICCGKTLYCGPMEKKVLRAAVMGEPMIRAAPAAISPLVSGCCVMRMVMALLLAGWQQTGTYLACLLQLCVTGF